MELFCLAMHKAALKVSLHIGMVVLAQTLAVLRRRHQARARLLSMLDNGGVLGRCQQGKRREGGRARAFDFSAPPHGMLIRNCGEMFYASYASLTMPDGALLPLMCPKYTGTLGTASCQFDFSGDMELPQHNASMSLMAGARLTSYAGRRCLPTAVGFGRGDLVTAHAIAEIEKIVDVSMTDRPRSLAKGGTNTNAND